MAGCLIVDHNALALSFVHREGQGGLHLPCNDGELEEIFVARQDRKKCVENEILQFLNIFDVVRTRAPLWRAACGGGAGTVLGCS
jgi:hypothetical protein